MIPMPSWLVKIPPKSSRVPLVQPSPRRAPQVSPHAPEWVQREKLAAAEAKRARRAAKRAAQRGEGK